MKQLTLSFLLAFLPLLASADPVEIDGIWYNLISKVKTAEVTRNPSYPENEGSYSGEVNIPEIVSYENVDYVVTSIGSYAFYCCYGLTSVTIPSSVTTIGERAFLCCGLKSVIIPNNVTEICYQVFYGCSELTELTIPEKVESIGERAFHYCSKLKSIVIPSSLKSIGSSAFSDCNSLISVSISDVASWCNIEFNGSESNPLTFAHHLYLDSNEILDLVIPNNVTSIGNYAFFGCSSLTSINIPNSVTSLGSSAFEGCSGLTSITIPNSVTSLGSSAFEGCSGLTSITIGNGVKTIINNAFAQCPELTDVFCLAEELSSNWGTGLLYTDASAFEGSYIEYATLHVPESAINAYKTTAPWSKFGKIVTLSGEESETPKCATPTISIEDGKIKFSCETDGVEFVSNVSTTDTKDYYDAELTLTYKYKVTVYATKAGYENSDTATMEITASGKLGDLNADGKVDVADHVKLSDIIMGK